MADKKSRYPIEERCLAHLQGEEPCQNPRRTCAEHCNANSKSRPGERCPKPPYPETLRCYYHGGPPQIGAGNPAFKHGRYSRYTKVLQGTGLESFEAALADPAYMESREEIALLDSMLMDALERSQIGHQGDLWQELGERAHQYKRALRADQPVRADNHLEAILEICAAGVEAYRSSVEAKDIIEAKRKVKDSERKRMTDEHQTISAARAMALVGAVIATVRKHVEGREDGREILAGISADISALIHADVTGTSGGPQAPD